MAGRRKLRNPFPTSSIVVRKEGKMPKVKRSLYQCLNAKVMEDRIYCAKGHRLNANPTQKADTLSILRLQRGEPLEMSICQGCSDYDEMGQPVQKNERGWAGMEKGEEK